MGDRHVADAHDLLITASCLLCVIDDLIARLVDALARAARPSEPVEGRTQSTWVVWQERNEADMNKEAP